MERLDQPLRVAIAGRVDAGKSTLLNALVGEQLAPTDSGECTRIVTWYRGAPSPEIVIRLRSSGSPVHVPVRRADGGLVIDLQGTPAEEVDRLDVGWPAQGLRAATLIDTPGIGSPETATTARRPDVVLHPDDETPTEADAVVYLMRHRHGGGATFLESFRDRGVARATSVNTIAVISRADEIGGGRVDSMSSAKAVAHRYLAEPALRGLCQDVVAVAGLIAQAGRTLRQTEFAALADLARGQQEDLEAALVTADRFLGVTWTGADRSPGLSRVVRQSLLARFGVFGIRLATALLRQGVGDAAGLAAELVSRSGLPELQEVLDTRFTGRRDLLKARSALLALAGVLQSDPRPGSGHLAVDVGRILAGAHELVELRLLGALRSRAVRLPEPLLAEAERLLGGSGAGPACRLGMPVHSDPAVLREAAVDALVRWREHAENPMSARAASDACRVVVRTCEGILAGLGQTV